MDNNQVKKYIKTLLNTPYFLSKSKLFKDMSHFLGYSSILGKFTTPEEIIRKRFDKVRKKIPKHLLMYDPEFDTRLTSNHDLFVDNNRFLNYYSLAGIDYALEKYGMKKLFRQIGFNQVFYKITKDDYTHTLSVYNEEINSDTLISQLVLTLESKVDFNDGKYKAMIIEWLNLQDYRKVFKETKMKLPGQRFPGLGFGLLAFELIIQIAERLNIEYIVNRPNHFHNAYIYSHYFSFKNPINKANIDALISDFKGLSLASLSWLVYNEAIIEVNSSTPLKWESDMMIMMVHQSKEFENYFKTEEYIEEYKLYIKNNTFKIDLKKFYEHEEKFPKMIFKDIKKYFRSHTSNFA